MRDDQDPALIQLSCFARHPKTAGGTATRSRKLGVDRDNFDRSVSPAQDFYRYVNGGWVDRVEIPEDKSSYGSFIELHDEAEENLRTLIEELASTDQEEGSEAQKIGDFYRSFMDTETVESRGLSPLDEEAARIDGIRDRAGLIGYFGINQQLGLQAPFSVFVSQDQRNASTYIAYLHQAGLGLPDRDYYLSDEARLVEIRKQYRPYIERLWALAGWDGAAEVAGKIFDLETRLARVHWTRVQNRDREATYNKYDANQASKLAPGLDWVRLLEATGVSSQTAFVVRQPSYFEALGAMLEEIPLEDWKTYFRYKLLDRAAPYLSEPFVEANFEFFHHVLRGVEKNRPRWKRGVEATATALGEAVGKLYVARHFEHEAKTRMDRLVGNLRRAFALAIDELDWMTDDTKAEARGKLAKFTPKIGYPEKWKDYSKLVVRRDDLIGNLLRSAKVEYERMTEKLGKPVDRTEWLMTPQTVNAYYNPTMNEVVFPAAILQPPFFDVNADDAVNYGAIGAVIGHELSHGFDDQGRKSDGEGNLRDWWTEADAEEFKRRARGLVEQFAAYCPIEGLHINGELTLGENIADLAGLTMAYRAYRLSLDGREPLVIDAFTGDQRFFLGWAQVWRGKYREDELRRRLVVDPHSPGPYRVNGVVRNMPAFYEAFGVEEGDGMYLPPEKRTEIW